MTENEALQAMLAHHRNLGDGVDRRVGAVREAVEAGASFEPGVAELVAYLASEVLPHAVAEEHSIYQAALAIPRLEPVIAGMVEEHRRLAASVERLATAEQAPGALEEAEAIGALFAGHVGKENELILPPLAADPELDLAGVLVQMHRLTEAAQRDTTAADFEAPDAEATLTKLLVDAASELARAGHGDRACRVVASAWAAVRTHRPDLAVRVTAALHRLARSVTAEPVSLTRGPRPAGTDTELDVRALAPAQRHETIFSTYAALAPGGAFVLVNDHDPKPLRYQFEAEHAGEFTWEALEEGPAVWRVRIARPEAPGVSGAAEAELDVRRFPHGQRHDSIFAAYQALAPGGGFVLVNDHDPVPLRYQFEAQHSGEFTWDYLQAGPDLWRVRIGRVAGAAAR